MVSIISVDIFNISHKKNGIIPFYVEYVISNAVTYFSLKENSDFESPPKNYATFSKVNLLIS